MTKQNYNVNTIDVSVNTIPPPPGWAHDKFQAITQKAFIPKQKHIRRHILASRKEKSFEQKATKFTKATRGEYAACGGVGVDI